MTPNHEEQVPNKKAVRYRECLKNHAASMGGNATDGCGEFMPSGEEGSIEALICSACNCHRNFHRKEVEGEASINDFSRVSGRKLILGHHQKGVLNPHDSSVIYPSGIVRGHAATPHQMILFNHFGSVASESDEQDQEGGGGVLARPHHHHHHHQQAHFVKKRFRTKFTQEQKEKMLNFAEKVGWKLQKQEESVVQQFCQEIGVKRRVLKVWMHNNKHNLAKKNSNPPAA